MFQFHKVQLKERIEYGTYEMIEFQFHKVQLKEACRRWDISEC